MISKIKDSIRSIFHTDEKEMQQQKNDGLLQKINNILGNNSNESGELTNPLSPYNRLNTRVAQRAKDYMTLASALKTKSLAKPNNTNAKLGELNDADTIQNPSIGQPSDIGFISAKYESGGNGGSVSSGKGDAGGVSYGVSQFSSKVGSADNFVSWLKNNNPTMASAFKNHKAGTNEFSNAWKQTFANYGDDFTKLQKQYTFESYVKPLADLAKKKTGIDYTRSTALKELLYSTAIQFGASSLGLSALGNVSPNMTDEEIINASYDKKISNYKNYFKSSSASVQEAVKNRFINERQDVLNLL